MNRRTSVTDITRVEVATGDRVARDGGDMPQQRQVWRSRPHAARLVRLAVVGVPFVVVVGAAWTVNHALGPSTGILESVARWCTLSVLSTLALVGIDRGARRFLPLSMLLQLSIVFPDAAPSRFKVALTRGSTRQLARDAAALQLDDATPQEAAEHLLAIIARLTSHDRLTRGHTERVRAYADMVGERMGLSEMERAKLHWGALIHDIGKIEVPAAILNKTAPLTEREWARLQTHPNEGWKLAQPLRGWLGEWARAIRDHHERWDGSGYPRGLAGHEISRAGRIVAVADAYDVMTSSRAYKSPMAVEAARAELARCAGEQFDPEVVRAFLSLSLFERRRTGPLAWIANSPIALQFGNVAHAPALATSALAAAISAGAVVAPVMSSDPPAPVAQRVVDDVVTTTTARPTTTPAPTTRAPTTTTTTTTTTSTTAPPPTTTAAPPPTTAATPPPPPTTAPPPTTTAAVIAEVPTTTTSAPVNAFTSGFLGGPAGGTFALVPVVGGEGAINWDAATDPDPGLTLVPEPMGLSEISAPGTHAWALAVADDLALEGQASLRLHVATAGFDPSGFGRLLGGLVDCAAGTSDCTTVGTGSTAWAQSSFGGDFGVVSIPLGAVTHAVPAGHQLLVTLAVPDGAGSNVWLAFGTSTHPSQLRLG